MALGAIAVKWFFLLLPNNYAHVPHTTRKTVHDDVTWQPLRRVACAEAILVTKRHAIIITNLCHPPGVAHRGAKASADISPDLSGIVS